MSVQATVSAFDAASRTGEVLLDDGRRMAFDADAVPVGVRLLRTGQRVRLESEHNDGDVRIVRVQLSTLP